jgi:hypothetical protein
MAASATNEVVARKRSEDIVLRISDEDVLALEGASHPLDSGEGVLPLSTRFGEIYPYAVNERVVFEECPVKATANIQEIVAGAAVQTVGSRPSKKDVVPENPGEFVSVPTPANAIIATSAVEEVSSR